MDTAAFLRHILADDGYKCICIKLEKGTHHRFFQSFEDAAQFALASDARGLTVYHACATFLSQSNRKQENVAWLKSLYSDVDVGADKPYKTRSEASAALTDFLAATGLPGPTVVYSGPVGMHLYWVLEQALPPARWRPYAVALRALMRQHGFHIDTARAADSASVLRPPGTHNRKHGLVYPVTVAHVSSPLRLAELPLRPVETYVHAHAERSVPRLLASASVYGDVPSDANKVADGCAQIGNLRDQKGNVSYYQWLFGIWTLHHCTDGDEIAHKWSSGHDNYSFEETQRKLDEDKSPITCAKFHEHNPDLCEACPYWKKLGSPLQLGRNVVGPQAKERQSSQLAVNFSTNGPPVGQAGGLNGHASASSFLNTDDGLFHLSEGKKGEPIHTLISSRPIALVSVCRSERNPDFSLHFEMTMPKAGTIPIAVGQGIFFSSQGMPELHRLGAVIHEHDLMRQYVREEIDKFNKEHEPATRYEQMGWKEHDNAFLVGRTLYQGAETITCNVSPEIERRARMLGPRSGSLQAWSAAANQLFAVGCEPHSFALCCAFGAVLMHFHSEEGGAIVNLVSEQSATGKTTGLEAVASVWGELDGIRLTDDDTRVSRGLLLGTLGNLPCVFDELHKRDPDAVRQFCIMFTNGRDKLRARPDGSLRDPVGDWQTILVLGSNQSIVDLLQAKAAAEEAQAFRVLEFHCTQNFVGHEGDRLRRTLRENSGWAGDAFIRMLMQPGMLEFVRKELEQTMHFFWGKGFERQHRFWVRCLACAYVAGHLVRHRGLLEFDPERIVDWAIARCIERIKGELKRTNAQLLNEALYEIWASTLVVDVEFKTKNMCQVLSTPNPNKGFYARRVRESGRMYVSRSWLYKWLTEHNINRSNFIRELQEARIVVNASKFVTLGAGTPSLHGGGQIMTVEIDMKHPKMADALEVAERGIDLKVIKFPRAPADAPSLPASSE